MMEAFKPMTPTPSTGTQNYPVKQPLFSVLEEKMDAILAYQKKAAHMALFRAIVSFIFFIVFIVLPVIGTFYLFQYMKDNNISLQTVVEQYKGAMDTVGQLKQTTGQIEGAIKSVMPAESRPAVPTK